MKRQLLVIGSIVGVGLLAGLFGAGARAQTAAKSAPPNDRPMTAAEFGPTTVVIVVRVSTERSERTLGLVVDAVSEVCNVNAEDRQPAPDFGAGIKTDFVKGLATVDKRMVILLDIDRLVSEGLLGELSVH